MSDPKLDLSRVSREALEELFHAVVSSRPHLIPEVARIRAEATAEPLPTPGCVPGSLCSRCHIWHPEAKQPPPRTRAEVDTARSVRECALSWDPDAKVIGNVRAADIVDLCNAAISALCASPAPAPAPTTALTGSDAYRFGQLCDELGVLPLDMGTLLLRYGLSMHPAPSPVTEHERAVLDAAGALGQASLEAFGKPASTPWVKFAHAELARRAAEREGH